MHHQPSKKDAYNRHASIESFRHTTLRLANHNYSRPGVYHVVNCAPGIGGRGPIFEHPILRKLLQTHWLDLPQRYPTLQLDEFTIMPDHLHFLIWPNKWPDRAEKPPFLWEDHAGLQVQCFCRLDSLREAKPPGLVRKNLATSLF